MKSIQGKVEKNIFRSSLIGVVVETLILLFFLRDIKVDALEYLQITIRCIFLSSHEVLWKLDEYHLKRDDEFLMNWEGM